MPYLYDSGSRPETAYFILALTGTVFLTIGMAMSMRIIEKTSQGRRFTNQPRINSKDTIFWLQPGNQRVGDQLFHSFAYHKKEAEYVTSWKRDKSSNFGFHAFERFLAVELGIAIVLSLSGFICQFLGLRGLHASTILYQLGSTLIMAGIRALLRSRRLERTSSMWLDEAPTEAVPP
jgi:hypothetical protein